MSTTTGHRQDVEIFGHRIRVSIREGDGSLPVPLVMCCGIGASLDVLDPLVEALDERLTVIRFDVPGVGASPAPLLPYTFPQLAWLTMRLLRRYGYDEVDVLGYSWGGALAQQMAAQFPRRVRRVVLLSTGTGALMIPGSPLVLTRMLSPRRFRDPEYAASLAALLYGGSARTRPDEVRGLFQHANSTGSSRGYLYQLLAGSVWTSLPFLRLIRQPTLVMTGDDDPIIPVINGTIMAKLLPRGQLHVFRGGHVEGVLRASAIAPLIADFVQMPNDHRHLWTNRPSRSSVPPSVMGS